MFKVNNESTRARDTEYLFVFSPNAGKHGPEKLRIRHFSFSAYFLPTFVEKLFSIEPIM